MREIFLKTIPQLASNIKDELLSSALIIIIMGLTFPSARAWIFVIWAPVFVVYSYIKMKLINISDNSVVELLNNYILDFDGWEKRFEGFREYWAYKKDPLFRIEFGRELVRDFKEGWMKKYPDMNNNYSFEVNIKYMNTVIQTLTFVALDGVRYIVPLPERKRNTLYYYKDSLETSLANVIGSYYLYNSLEEFAKAHKINFRKTSG